MSTVPLESSLESPLPVRTVARAIGSWIARLGRIWVEGQVTELSRRPGMGTVFLTLRDPAAEVSLRVTCSRALCDALGPQLGEGARVVVWARPEFQLARGTLTLTAYDVRPIGIGELLLRLERLKSVLAAEGLFAAERKRSLPFLPAGIGLVTGRGSAASRDIQENAVRRWPAVRFTVREVPVQGPAAAAAVAEAMRELDHDSSVDVIVVARGGGSVEDLLPFSDEHLLRTAAALSKPLVSAIGHEQDAPLLDLVSDVRASTPTDAAKRLVPDLGEQVQHIGLLRRRARRCCHTHPRPGDRGPGGVAQPTGARRPGARCPPAQRGGHRAACPVAPLPAAPARSGRRRPGPGRGPRAGGQPGGDAGPRLRRRPGSGRDAGTRLHGRLGRASAGHPPGRGPPVRGRDQDHARPAARPGHRDQPPRQAPPTGQRPGARPRHAARRSGPRRACAP